MKNMQKSVPEIESEFRKRRQGMKTTKRPRFKFSLEISKVKIKEN